MSKYFLRDIDHIKKNIKMISKKLLLMIVIVFLHPKGKVQTKRKIISIFNFCKEISIRVIDSLIRKVIKIKVIKMVILIQIMVFQTVAIPIIVI
jgi:hypothetical protein